MEEFALSNSNSTTSEKSDVCSSQPVLLAEKAGRCQQNGPEECGFPAEIEMVYPELRTRDAVARIVVSWRNERRFMRKIIV